MKIFADYRASRTFTNLYETLDEDEKIEFGESIRDLADEKVMAEEGEEFYVTIADIKRIYAVVVGD